jgi:hypothetical protein
VPPHHGSAKKNKHQGKGKHHQDAAKAKHEASNKGHGKK